MWRYRVVFRGNKKDLEFELPDNQLLLDWQAWVSGDTSKKVGSSVAEGAGAVINFPDVTAIVANEYTPSAPFVVNPSRPPLSSRARPLFGDRE
jgi:hypothetical protein